MTYFMVLFTRSGGRGPTKMTCFVVLFTRSDGPSKDYLFRGSTKITCFVVLQRSPVSWFYSHGLVDEAKQR